MTEVPAVLLAYPCDVCGAQPGEVCSPGCANGSVPDDDAAAVMMAAVYRLPFGSLLADPPDRSAQSAEEWLAELAEWMTDYVSVLAGEVDRLSCSARKAISLQIEKDVMRGFFLNPPVDTS